MENYQQEAKIYKALVHPARLAILDILRESEQCVCHMEAHLGYRQAYISQHLMVLREAGLVEDRRDGWNIYYRVTRPEVFDILDAATRFLKIDPAAACLTNGSKSSSCPCPKCNPVVVEAAV